MAERIRSTRSVVFPEASPKEERIAAILINKAPDGSLRAYTADVPGRQQPDPELISMLVQSVEIQSL